MNRKSTVLSVVLGLIGLGLHGWAKASGFTHGSHLPIPHAPVWLALWSVTLLVPLLALLLALPLRRCKPDSARSPYAAAAWAGRTIGGLGGAFLLLGSLFSGIEAVEALSFQPMPGGLMPLLLALLLFLSGLVMLFTALTTPQRSPGAELMLPGFAVAFLLIQFYHSHAQDPVLEHYGWILVALMALALGLYLSAGVAFRPERPYWNYVCLFTAGAWCLSASISAAERGYSAILAGFALWCFWHCDLTICHACPPGTREAVPPQS